MDIIDIDIDIVDIDIDIDIDIGIVGIDIDIDIDIDVRCVLLLHPVTAVLCTMIGLVVQVFMDVRSP